MDFQPQPMDVDDFEDSVPPPDKEDEEDEEEDKHESNNNKKNKGKGKKRSNDNNNNKKKSNKDAQDQDKDRALTARLTSLTSDLFNLNVEAQEQLYTSYRHSTQRTLSRETAELYKAYAQHGSMVRLSSSLHEFLARPQLGTDDDKDDIDSIAIDQLGDSSGGSSSSDNKTKTNPHTQHPPYATEPACTPFVAGLGFYPADVKITFPAHMALPIQVPRAINNILLLQNSLAQTKLRHHVAKYCLPFPYPWSGQRTGLGDAHPHILPLFRLAIAEPLQHRLSTIFTGQSEQTHHLGLSLEAVKLLRQAYDAKSGGATSLELYWLARSLRVHLDVVKLWWREEDHARRSEKMMIIWVAARELERMRWYKERGML